VEDTETNCKHIVAYGMTDKPSTDVGDDSTADVSLTDLIGCMKHLDCQQDHVDVRGFQIKYWLFSNPKKPLGNRFPVVALHGGPSMPHNYILPLKLLADLGYPVLFYDQCGCGESKNGIDDPKKNAKLEYLLTVEYYVQELYKVIEGVGLTQYYVYGSSWGSLLAQEFALTQPSGLLGLILDGTFCCAQEYSQTQWRDLISTLPTFSQNKLKQLVAEKKFDSKGYKAIEEALTPQFTTRLVPHPKCFLDTLKYSNPAICKCFELIFFVFSLTLVVDQGMQGPSEFSIGGTLEHWSTVDRLHQVRVPTLVVRGEYDTMTAQASQHVVDLIPTSWPMVTIPRAA